MPQALTRSGASRRTTVRAAALRSAWSSTGWRPERCATSPLPELASWRTGLRNLPALLLALVMAAASGCATVDGNPPKTVAARQLAAGVYLLPADAGHGSSVDAANQGRIGNAGFIVGPHGVIAVDTGTSYRHGVELLAAIGRVTDQPVRLALITHTRQEFLFGAAAYRERGIPLQMHAEAARLMAARCDGCLKTLRQTLGEEAMRGTTSFKPDAVFERSHALDLIGRPVQVLYFGHSSGPGDIAVLDTDSGVLFAGGLLDAGRVPDVVDGRLSAWQQALSALRGLPLRVVVPGHGPPSPPALIDSVDTYLTQLEARVKQLLASGAALSDVPDAAALPAYEHWDEYATVHRRNASVVFLRLELEQLLR